jgi:hypothetical protein
MERIGMARQRKLQPHTRTWVRDLGRKVSMRHALGVEVRLMIWVGGWE